MKKETLITTTGLDHKKYNGSVNPPVYHMSTIVFSKLIDYVNAKNEKSIYNSYNGRDCSYGSVGSITAQDLSKALSSLELDREDNCETLIYPSGLLALSFAAITFTSAGKHILVSDNAYLPFKRFIQNDLANMGVEYTFYNPEESLDNLIQNNTSLIMIENPSSVTCEITDIEAVVKLAKEHSIITVMDNTWATPVFFRPLEHGIDISLYAATKYINGHSDVLMGVSHAKGDVFKKLYQSYMRYGVAVNSQDCYLVQRGLRTLHLRLELHQESAMKVAKYLESVPEVKYVLYPALPSSSQYKLWKKYYSGATSLFSIILDKKYTFEQLAIMIDNMKIFSIGSSWGSYKSLVLSYDFDELCRKHNKYNTSCIRIFCGLENADDLIEDLDKAFVRLRNTC